MALERSTDDKLWVSLLKRLSGNDKHGSWRRAALLALVRSEIGGELLSRASDVLLKEDASMLRELIRITMAVEVDPATELLIAAGVDPALVPESFNIPRGSWYRLIVWLLSLGDKFPAVAIPDVSDLYMAWSLGMWGRDFLTPVLLSWLYRWLKEIELAREAESLRELRQPFGGAINHRHLQTLESNLRTGFLCFCDRKPELAAEYLVSLGRLCHNDDILRSLMKFPGNLAQAAPAELSELTLNALLRKPHQGPRDYNDELEEPFNHLDFAFTPPSSSQGPFLGLLKHAPEHGLSLIHRLVDHALAFYSGGRATGADEYVISFPEGERKFPWEQSYAWSWEMAAVPSCITSALMALEVWAHNRIESGDAFDMVLNDVLGPPGSPAAYLLVAVDLLVSHWPKSRESAIPFLACPELLSIDRELCVLRKRPPRGLMLENFIDELALVGPEEVRDLLVVLLRRTAKRLGPPRDQSDLRDPAFMVAYAINRACPGNWIKKAVTLSDGNQGSAYEYVSPDEEKRHFEALQAASRDTMLDANMLAGLDLVLGDPSRSSPEFATAAVKWAQDSLATPKEEAPEDRRMREESIITAALIALRDGDANLCAEHSAWARAIFLKALQTEGDPVLRHRAGLRFNPNAIAFFGLVLLLKYDPQAGDLRTLLVAAGSKNPAAVHGFSAAAAILASIDERFPRAMLRCAFTACIHPRRGWDVTEEEAKRRAEAYLQRVQAAVDSELTWLEDQSPEPDWPAFPPLVPERCRRLRIPGGGGELEGPEARKDRADVYADHQGASLWLDSAKSLYDVVKRPWLRGLANAYGPWTAIANGAGLEMDDDIGLPPTHWNDAYYDFLAHCLPGLSMKEISALALRPIRSLPDVSFFNVITPLLRSVDALYFNENAISEKVAVIVRASLVQRMLLSNGWRRLGGSSDDSIEVHIGPAIATLFFNDYWRIQPASCYLREGVDRLDPFLPVLQKLVANGPCYFVAIVTLNLVEVYPRPSQLQFVVTAAKAWLAAYPDNSKFWLDYEIGRRLCAWIRKVLSQEPSLCDVNKEVRFDAERLLASLVSLGVPEAMKLEEMLISEQGPVE
jgi:hypothetical protein